MFGTVHDIDVEAIGPSLLRLAHLRTQVGKVGGENGRGPLYGVLIHVLFLLGVYEARAA